MSFYGAAESEDKRFAHPLDLRHPKGTPPSIVRILSRDSLLRIAISPVILSKRGISVGARLPAVEIRPRASDEIH